MKKKIILIGLLIFVLVIIGVFITCNQNFQNNEITVGDAVFMLPEGYSEFNSSSSGVKISNGANNILIFYYNDSNIDKYINEYNESKSNENVSLNSTSFTVNNIFIQKYHVVNNPYVVHYWFIYNHKVYSIYTEDANKDIDVTVSNLIKSLNNTS